SESLQGGVNRPVKKALADEPGGVLELHADLRAEYLQPLLVCVSLLLLGSLDRFGLGLLGFSECLIERHVPPDAIEDLPARFRVFDAGDGEQVFLREMGATFE